MTLVAGHFSSENGAPTLRRNRPPKSRKRRSGVVRPFSLPRERIATSCLTRNSCTLGTNALGEWLGLHLFAKPRGLRYLGFGRLPLDSNVS
jgi:hypothetical protein